MAEDSKYRKKNNLGPGQWIAIGVAIGAGLGVALDNIAIGIGIGIALGVAIGGISNRKKG